jgi:tRNA dimethylallyltransferase
MIAEAKKLHAAGLSWKRMEELGLEYRYLARFLQNKISKEEMITQLASEIWHYARRQKTWFRRDKKIKWFEVTDLGNIEKEIKYFLLPE